MKNGDVKKLLLYVLMGKGKKTDEITHLIS